MRMTLFRVLPLFLFLLVAAAPPGLHAQRLRVSLDRLPHIHGLAVAPSEPSRLYLATHDGLYLASPEGYAEPVPGLHGDIMSFVVHPKESNTMFASGHPPQGGSLGVHVSSDGGKNWRRFSAGGPDHVGFHDMDISAADPNVIYGVSSGLYVSGDGGHSWREVGPAPAGLIDLAASSRRTDTLFAATRSGLLISRNGGADWEPAYPLARLTTMAHVSPGGRVHVFILGVGLLTATEPGLSWQLVSKLFYDRIPLRMTVAPDDPKRLYIATATGAVLVSRDGGKTWIGFEGSHNARPEIIAKGKKLYDTYCQACHGVAGKGQDPKSIPPNTPKPILAPALNDNAHAWHHSDRNLAATILHGSPRKGSPMVAWKNQLSREDAESIVAYIKSLWSFRSLACQGARHMACMSH
jgi:mono/diheme cytochrome c family protein